MSLFIAPVPWVTVALAFVAVPMIALRGQCWLTNLERSLRRRGRDLRWKSPSMTRRLIYWFSFGTISLRNTKRMQWWLIGGVASVWLFRAAMYWG